MAGWSQLEVAPATGTSLSLKRVALALFGPDASITCSPDASLAPVFYH